MSLIVQSRAAEEGFDGVAAGSNRVRLLYDGHTLYYGNIANSYVYSAATRERKMREQKGKTVRSESRGVKWGEWGKERRVGTATHVIREVYLLKLFIVRVQQRVVYQSAGGWKPRKLREPLLNYK